jgi:hypothetical protein
MHVFYLPSLKRCSTLVCPPLRQEHLRQHRLTTARPGLLPFFLMTNRHRTYGLSERQIQMVSRPLTKSSSSLTCATSQLNHGQPVGRPQSVALPTEYSRSRVSTVRSDRLTTDRENRLRHLERGVLIIRPRTPAQELTPHDRLALTHPAFSPVPEFAASRCHLADIGTLCG